MRVLNKDPNSPNNFGSLLKWAQYSLRSIFKLSSKFWIANSLASGIWDFVDRDVLLPLFFETPERERCIFFLWECGFFFVRMLLRWVRSFSFFPLATQQHAKTAITRDCSKHNDATAVVTSFRFCCEVTYPSMCSLFIHANVTKISCETSRCKIQKSRSVSHIYVIIWKRATCSNYLPSKLDW